MSTPDASKPVYPISGLRLVADDGVVKVLVEHEGSWKRVIDGAVHPALFSTVLDYERDADLGAALAPPTPQRARVARHARRRK